MAKSRRLVRLIAACLALSGCSAGSGALRPTTSTGSGALHLTNSTLTSWNRLSVVSVRNKIRSAKVRKKSSAVASGASFPGDDTSPKESELDTLKPYSKEWWSVRDAIDIALETKLAKKLIICRDCMPPKADDQTGSIASK
jgi:hypothetical protein